MDAAAMDTLRSTVNTLSPDDSLCRRAKTVVISPLPIKSPIGTVLQPDKPSCNARQPASTTQLSPIGLSAAGPSPERLQLAGPLRRRCHCPGNTVRQSTTLG